MTAEEHQRSTAPAGSSPDGESENSFPTPPVPHTLAEAGLSDSQVLSLILKTLHRQGALTGHELARKVALPFSILDEILLMATQRHFLEVLGTSGHSRTGYRFDLTEEGGQRAQSALKASRYIGPAPVPLDQFSTWIKKQSVRNTRILKKTLTDAFSDLVLPPEVLAALGPAVNSGASIFLHGAAGNGKTAIAERLASVVSSEIFLPHSIIVDGHIIVIHDPVYHKAADDQEWDDGKDSGLILKDASSDRRFLRVKRPTVFVGGELTADQLDLQLSDFSQIYRAPFQIKAAGGVLIIDDFGRQRMTPAELLNRWIVPLEKGFDNLTLDTGVRFPVPFDCILIFATNLNPRNLVDEAFLRRIQFKVEIRSPDRKAFEDIFRMNCWENKLEYDPSAVDFLFRKFYVAHGIRPRGCHPRDILHHINSIASFEGIAPSLDPELLRRAAKAYFLVMEEEYQAQITSVSSLG